MKVWHFLTAAAIGITGGSAVPAYASDYGCQVLLCLSNPTGSMAYTECVPPIEKLFTDLALGRSFPMCDLGGVVRSTISGRRGTSSYAVTMYYADGSLQTFSLAGGAPGPVIEPSDPAPRPRPLPGENIQ